MQLLDVQKEALKRADGKPGFAFFMEQGLGKTLTTLAEFSELVAERKATRLVVICPNSFKGGWKVDAEKHGLDFDFFIWEAGMETYVRTWMRRGFKKPPVLVVNYEAIRSEATRQIIKDFVLEVEGRAMITFDESIQIKTHDSAQTKAVIGAAGNVKKKVKAVDGIAKYFNYRRILSGKPITSGPHDMWSQMRAIGAFDGFAYYPFKTAFCRMGGFKAKQVMGAQNEDILAERLDPYVFRATKVEWTDLPPKMYTIREYKMTPEMKVMYDSMYNDFVLWLNDGENVSVDAAITKYIKLAQIQCGWVYREDGKVEQLVPDDRNPRLQLLLQVLEEEVTGKVAIPYHHKPVFDQLMRALGGEAKCAWIKGGMTSDEIEEQKRRFNNDKEVRYILLQDNASKYGHTLLGLPEVGHMCYTMIIYENNYSLDTRSQIEDRIHRHGQSADSVLYLDLVGTPLDRDCVSALQRKETIFQAVFSLLRR